MGQVQDRVAVVTGGANRSGQAVACRLAEEGARLVLGDLDAGGLERTAAHITSAGGAAHPERRERYGRLDISVASCPNGMGETHLQEGARDEPVWINATASRIDGDGHRPGHTQRAHYL